MFHICGEEVQQFIAVISPFFPFISIWWQRLTKGKRQ